MWYFKWAFFIKHFLWPLKVIKMLSWCTCDRVFQSPNCVAHYELIRRETVRSHKFIKVAMVGDSSWLLKLSVHPAWAWMDHFTALTKHLTPVWLHRATSPCAWASLKRAVEMREMLFPPSKQRSCKSGFPPEANKEMATTNGCFFSWGAPVLCCNFGCYSRI